MTVKPNVAAGSVTIDLRGLADGAHSFRVDAPGAVLQVESEPDSVLRDARISGTLTRSEAIFQLRGALQGTLESVCDRCLIRFDRPVETELELDFTIGDGESRGSEDPPAESETDGDEPVLRLPAGTAVLDLTETLREAVLLDFPIKNVCREECRGLCPRCGANRNQEPCNCDPAAGDSRWDALRGLSFPTNDQE